MFSAETTSLLVQFEIHPCSGVQAEICVETFQPEREGEWVAGLVECLGPHLDDFLHHKELLGTVFDHRVCSCTE